MPWTSGWPISGPHQSRHEPPQEFSGRVCTGNAIHGASGFDTRKFTPSRVIGLFLPVHGIFPRGADQKPRRQNTPAPHRVRKHLPADTYPRALSHAILTGNRYESAERISSIGYNQLGHQMQNFAVFILSCKCPSGLAKCAISETQTVTDYVFCCFTQEPLHGETASGKIHTANRIKNKQT